MPFKDKAKEREWWRERRKTLRRILDSAKGVPCLDCGGSFPVVCMQFDHVRGEKKFSLANAKGHATSIKSLEDEIAKCEVICANCHFIRENASRQENGDRWART